MRLTALTTATLVALALSAGGGVDATSSSDDPVHSPALDTLNTQLRAGGRTDIAIAKAELLVSAAAGRDFATTIVANDRTHLTAAQFVENDPRRPSPPNTITYLVDQSDGSALSWVTVPGGAIAVLPNAVTEAEIDASMAVWGAMRCNGPLMQKVPDTGADPDVVDGLVLGNPALIGTPMADVTHAGWLPGAFFNLLAPQGSSFILGVTFTFVFVDANGDPTDIDGDRHADVAFREIYYNRAIPWGTGGNESNVDIQSVAIHEAGHALGLAHFGKVFIKNNGTIQFAPKAIMNAVYVSEDRTIRGTDNGSFCQAWARSH